jgi:collagen type III alpha
VVWELPPSPSSSSPESSQNQSRPGSDTDDGSSGDTAAEPSAAKPGEPGAPNTTASSSAGGSAGDGGDLGAANDQAPPPPDPVNVDYAKKATDLVLDYLDQNREAPDPQLLEDLQWSKEDLQRFADRWRDVREMSQQPGELGNGDMEEALKSLGLRPKNGTSSNTQEAGDAMRGIRDSGNRKPPPPAFRDAFDAFRRAVGQGK